MTDRLYYRDSLLDSFSATVVDFVPGDRPAVVLDRTAFYPSSGGQLFDTGTLIVADTEVRVCEVAETSDGRILHFLDEAPPPRGVVVRGQINMERRLDHMQQHSGQHVLTAAFIRLYGLETVSFHMGNESCSIDLQTNGLTAEQIAGAEALANQIVFKDLAVEIRFVTREEAEGLGVRKIPAVEHQRLRLIDIHTVDLTACGGTHVTRTGQIGAILLRKAEKVRQGWRVEFVCGKRAVRAARRDFSTLTECAGLVSGPVWEVPQQVRKLQESVKTLRRTNAQIQEELASFHAQQLLAEAAEDSGRKLVTRIFADRDLDYIKLLAQRAVRQGTAICLFAATAGTPALVFAQTAGLPYDMGALMKQVLGELGGRGGGSKDMAQGGPERIESLEQALNQLGSQVRGRRS
ncbi:MAG TPA: DHHA1 domain-containing protein [Terriglobales bacterium]|nr:DHHA1 domain-containing protein [Terriglobales bacterium]